MRDSKGIIDEITSRMENEKLFVKQNLSIEDVARAVNTNRTYVWKAVSELGVNFASFVNNFRAQYAISLLLTKKHRFTPLGDIAEMSGFANVRHMNKYLKRSVGETAGALRLRVFGHSFSGCNVVNW